VRKIASNYHLPYFTLTPTFSICPSHGYLKGEQPRCAHCNQETEIYSRVVGYLRPVKQWNDGKQAEYALRKTYRVDSIDPEAGVTVITGRRTANAVMPEQTAYPLPDDVAAVGQAEPVYHH
jgi:hypothetical protein